MSMTDAERTALGEAAREARRVRFGDSKKQVYDAAEVNPATLDRIERGQRVRGDRLTAVVRALWPESEGDWRRVLAQGSPSPTSEPAGLEAFTAAQLATELARRLTQEEMMGNAQHPAPIARGTTATTGQASKPAAVKGGHEKVKRQPLP